MDTISVVILVACYLGEDLGKVRRERDVEGHRKLNGDDYLFGLDFKERRNPS